MFVDLEVFLILFAEPLCVLSNRIDLPELVKRNGVSVEHDWRVVSRPRLMKQRRMNGLNGKLLKTWCDNHIIWRWWTRTWAWLDNSPYSLHIEHHPAASRDVIVSAVNGKVIVTIALAQINVFFLVETAEIFGKGWCAVVEWDDRKIQFNWIINFKIALNLPQKRVVICHDNPFHALQCRIPYDFIQHKSKNRQTFLAMAPLGVGNLRGNSRNGIVAHIAEDPQVNRKLRPGPKDNRQAFFMILFASFYSK